MPLIAMTREMGSLGKDVAAMLAERRGGKVVYHEIIDQRADKMRVRKSHVIRLLDGGARLWEQLTADKTSLAIFTADETYRFLRDDGIAVVRGWGAVHLLAGIAHVIRVRICAPLELRVDRMMARVGSQDREAVRREVELADEAHAAIARRHFHVDWGDSEHYDLVLSTERLSVEECVEEIERVAALPRFQPTPESRRLVDDRALQWAVLAAVRRDRRTDGARVKIECEDGLARVIGCDPQETQALSEVVRCVEGVKAVEFECRAPTSTASIRSSAEWRREMYLRSVKAPATP
ncbi:MAG TPA: cytidylate kinase family protein [Usitatibacter sp.]|nr:cytidylate kinase family protein [Usitatibacter sp.]